VDARGFTFSSVVLQSSGKVVDQIALKLAAAARFEPLKSSGPGAKPPDEMTFGKMIFEWQTLPPAFTNTSPAAP
jgi:hypothetical protein